MIDEQLDRTELLAQLLRVPVQESAKETFQSLLLTSRDTHSFGFNMVIAIAWSPSSTTLSRAALNCHFLIFVLLLLNV